MSEPVTCSIGTFKKVSNYYFNEHYSFLQQVLVNVEYKRNSTVEKSMVDRTFFPDFSSPLDKFNEWYENKN